MPAIAAACTQTGALSVSALTGSPICEAGMLVPSLSAVQSPCATTTSGHRGTVDALPLAETLEVLRRYGALRQD